LMPKETAGVGETWKLFAALSRAFVGSIVLVHMLDEIS
jgi:hypothetical protein